MTTPVRIRYTLCATCEKYDLTHGRKWDHEKQPSAFGQLYRHGHGGIETGDKLLIVGHGEKGLMLVQIDALREFISTMMEDLQLVEQEYRQHDRKTHQPAEDTH